MQDISKIKLPIGIIAIIIIQAFGLIWYVATLDSTVKQVSQTVDEIRTNTAEQSVAVIQNDISNIKTNIEKLEQSSPSSIPVYDDSEILLRMEELEAQIRNIQGGMREERTWLENIQATLDTPEEVSNEVEISSAEIEAMSKTLSNILDGKGSMWKKSKLKERIEALEGK